ncbi:MAG: alpha/beta hydrolase [Opitutaceae bacterium]
MMKLVAVVVLISAAVLISGAVVVGGRLVSPHRLEIGPPPVDFPSHELILQNDSGSEIRGWVHMIPEPTGTLLLLHGIRSDRRSMLGRARFLSAAGFNTVVIDLRAHGESGGNQITFGKLEALDVSSVLRFIRSEFPRDPIGIIGCSLGGAAAILSESEVEVAALVVEATFTSIEMATNNRMKIKLGPGGSVLTPLLTVQFRFRLGFEPEEVSPLARISSVAAPILIINGSEDGRTTPAEAQALFDAASGHKELWIVEGAGHVDLHRFAQDEYERRVLGFLRAHMLGAGSRTR